MVFFDGFCQRASAGKPHSGNSRHKGERNCSITAESQDNYRRNGSSYPNREYIADSLRLHKPLCHLGKMLRRENRQYNAAKQKNRNQNPDSYPLPGTGSQYAATDIRQVQQQQHRAGKNNGKDYVQETIHL